MSTSAGTTPLCAHCGRPIIGTPMKMGGAGDAYHVECTLPPPLANQPMIVDRDCMAKLVIETTQVMADGYRGGVTKFSTSEAHDKAEACAAAVSNAGVFILQAIGLSMDDIKERMVAFRNSQSDA